MASPAQPGVVGLCPQFLGAHFELTSDAREVCFSVGALIGSAVTRPPRPTQCLVTWHPLWGARGKPGLSPAHRSIKRYFLMDQGDFFVHFMDLTEEELKKPVDDITPTRLEALLELALRMSTANTDPFKDDLKVGPW